MRPVGGRTRRLLVLYDAGCAFCVRCRLWLEREPTYVPLTFLPAGSDEARAWFAQPLPWLGRELVVVDEWGQSWVGPAAFLMCLWSTRRYREWAYRLSGPSFAPLAERFFDAVSSRRRSIARVLGPAYAAQAADQCRHRDCG